MDELKRCPFCGDEVEIVPTGLYHWKYAICHKSKTECILDVKAFAIPYEEEDAVRMWNTRADRKTEPTIFKMEQVETMSCQECKHWQMGYHCDVDWDCKYEPKDEPQTERSE